VFLDAGTLCQAVTLTFDLLTLKVRGTELTAFSGVRGPNFTKLGQEIGGLPQHCTFVSEFGCHAAFSYAGGSNL